MNTLKLYAWQPSGHGSLSLFVIAESKENAIKAVELKITQCMQDPDYYATDFDGWGTDYYQLTVSDVGDVVFNDNQ